MLGVGRIFRSHKFQREIGCFTSVTGVSKEGKQEKEVFLFLFFFSDRKRASTTMLLERDHTVVTYNLIRQL